MIIPDAPVVGMKTYSRMTYVHAFQVQLDGSGQWLESNRDALFAAPIRVMPDMGLNPANRRVEEFISYWLCNGRTQESWRLKDGDWVVIDAVDPANALVMSAREFESQFTVHEKVLTASQSLDKIDEILKETNEEEIHWSDKRPTP